MAFRIENAKKVRNRNWIHVSLPRKLRVGMHTRTRHEGERVIFEIRLREDKLYCPKYKSRYVIKSSSIVRQFK